MADITNTVRVFLDEQEFHYNFDEERNAYELGLKLNNGSCQVRIVCRDKEDYFMVFAFWEGKLPVKSVSSVLPIINDINFNTRFTTLTIDPEDGELACHCGANTDGVEPSTDMVGVSLHVTVKTLDDNIERIMSAAWSSPANADGKFN